MDGTFEPIRDPEMDRSVEKRRDATAEAEARFDIGYQVKLDIFEGPLDLLLHLIRKNEVDIYDIPIALVTEQYLGTLDLMKSLNLDVAGEFLLMAATLAQIKSRMLLPPSEEDEAEEDDPRADLVRQLLEYERFKEAAGELEARPQLYREVFPRLAEVADTKLPPGEEPLAEVSVFELMDAFRRVWERAPRESFHEITPEKITLREKIHELLELLESVDSVTFEELLEPAGSRQALVMTFLAILELTRLRIVRIYQVVRYGAIRVQKAVATVPEDREAIARQLDEEAANGEGGLQAEGPAEGQAAESEEGLPGGEAPGEAADATPAGRDPEEGS